MDDGQAKARMARDRAAGDERAAGGSGAAAFTLRELAALRLVQGDLPHEREPFAAIAREAGLGEEAVLALLRSLKESGHIRRFGASVRHRRLGYAGNCMVVWKIDARDCPEAGRIAGSFPWVSHCYVRPALQNDWPYTFYTMLHARSAGECGRAVERLRAASPLFTECVVLPTLRELKKTSPRYF